MSPPAALLTAAVVPFDTNGDLDVKPRTVGFALLVFPLNEPLGGRVNYISNADRASMVVALKELLARWEGQPEVRGRA